MTNLFIFLIMLFGHWVADFIYQTEMMSLNKSKDPWILSEHVNIYALVMSFFVEFIYIIFNYNYNFNIVIELFTFTYLVCFLSHFAIDFVTSKITSKLYEKREMHWFFVTIGFDQFLHFGVIVYIIYSLGV